MKVIMYPAIGEKNENRYIDILVNSLRTAGVEIENWHKHLSFQNGDVFHVHWPEIIAEIQARKYNSLRGKWIAFQFFSTIKRIKKGGGRILWTIHDLAPHVASLQGDVFFKLFLQRFINEVDIALSLTTAGINEILRQMPELNKATFCVTRHPHYRDVLKGGSYSYAFRQSLGIHAEQTIFSFLGTLRANKRPELVVSAFCDLPQNENFLIMAGAAPPEVISRISAATADKGNIKLYFRKIPELEMVQLYSATDILVFPGSDYFNSGTIYTALSLNVPIIARWSPTNAEIQELVGAEWLYLYDGMLTTQTLLDGRRALIKRQIDTVCNMLQFSPENCALDHLKAYQLKPQDKFLEQE